MKHIHTFSSFLNEGKMGLNTTILSSTKDFTWVYQTGKDSSKTAFEINKKLNDLGIPSFISKTTGDTIGIPTKDLQTAFNKVLSKYDNIKQFAYSDGTKIDKNLINESFLGEGSIVAGIGATKHYEGDVFVVAKDFNQVNKFGLIVGSNTKNPKGTKVLLPIGYEIVFDEQTGEYVYFTFLNPETKKEDRGHTKSGSLKNMLTSGNITYLRGHNN